MKKHLFLCMSMFAGCFSLSALAGQMAIWTFDDPVDGTEAVKAVHAGLQGTPSIVLLNAEIDDNGKGGIGYMDVEGVVWQESRAAAWDDVNKSDSDAEWICAISTLGFEGISVRFDYMGNADTPIESLDLEYRINGADWVEVANNYTIAAGDTWKVFTFDYSSELDNRGLVEFRFDDLESGDSNDDFRFDNFEVRGMLIPEPATLILLALGALKLRRR